MNKQQALQLVAQAVARVQADLQTHQTMQQAIKILAEAIADKKEEAPKKAKDPKAVELKVLKDEK